MLLTTKKMTCDGQEFSDVSLSHDEKSKKGHWVFTHGDQAFNLYYSVGKPSIGIKGITLPILLQTGTGSVCNLIFGLTCKCTMTVSGTVNGTKIETHELKNVTDILQHLQ